MSSARFQSSVTTSSGCGSLFLRCVCSFCAIVFICSSIGFVVIDWIFVRFLEPADRAMQDFQYRRMKASQQIYPQSFHSRSEHRRGLPLYKIFLKFRLLAFCGKSYEVATAAVSSCSISSTARSSSLTSASPFPIPIHFAFARSFGLCATKCECLIFTPPRALVRLFMANCDAVRVGLK